jgi:hypothetical protein
MSAKQAISLVDGVLVMVLGGLRDRGAAEAGYAAFRERFDAAGVRCVLFDTRLAQNATRPEELVQRARDFGAATPPCRVAILACSLDQEFARLYRRGLIDSGHDVQIFTAVDQARAWLAAPVESDRLYLA